jgi:hypothetical protein
MGLAFSGLGIENRNLESEKSLGRPMSRDESTRNLGKGDAVNFAQWSITAPGLCRYSPALS